MNPTRRAGERSYYSDDDRILALRWLDFRHGDVSRTARELGMPIPTLHQWARGNRMWGMIDRKSNRPLTNLYAFRGRTIPLLIDGERLDADLSKLTGEEVFQFLTLLGKCSEDGEEV